MTAETAHNALLAALGVLMVACSAYVVVATAVALSEDARKWRDYARLRRAAKQARRAREREAQRR